MARIALQTPDKPPQQLASESDGLVTIILINLSGANIYLERDPAKCNAQDGYPLPNNGQFPANNTWKGNLYASCDLANGVVFVLKSAELKP